MNEELAQKIVDEINLNFGPRYLPEGFVSAKIIDNSILIEIGPRNMQIGFDGEPMGSGSMVGIANKWIITERALRKMSKK